ncbi:hypothetical protein [Micromonospora zamorensis]|uniref:hypothetical protein n=1 Tax=Micromonospora zamorensis TaxID=709883 RepID=UPI00339F6039|nr:hypothetical protein OHA01_11525 [Micromonospora zamorensis]
MTGTEIVCGDCGTVPPGRPGRRPLCPACKLNRRITLLLDDGTGHIRPALRPLATALRNAPNLSTSRLWLYKPQAAELLTALATGRVPLSHDGLSTWPRPGAARHLRHRLIAYGILPPVDPSLADIESWLRHRLAQLSEHPHEQVLRQYALWHQLPRLRATAASRPLRSTAKPYATQQFTQAQLFLTWLHDNGIEPAALTQSQLDTWYAAHRVHQRYRVRGFLTWATSHGHLPCGLVVHQVTFKPGTTITQQRRLELLRHYLTDDAVALPARVAAVLILLYAQPLSRIHRLTRDDLLTIDGTPHLRLGDPPSPLPNPAAHLLHRLVDEGGSGSQWLFPGRLPDQPVAYATLHRRLRGSGFPLGEARISALRQLVLQAPAPVIADALGFHQTTTTRQHANAGATWSRYPANRNTQ